MWACYRDWSLDLQSAVKTLEPMHVFIFFLACKLQEPFEKVCENNVLERFKFSKAFQMLFTYEDCA